MVDQNEDQHLGSLHSKSWSLSPFSYLLLPGSRSEVKSLSRVQLFATPWTVAHQAPPSMGFFRQEYWSGLLFPSPGDLPDPGTEPRSPALQAEALTSEPLCHLLIKWQLRLTGIFLFSPLPVLVSSQERLCFVRYQFRASMPSPT